MPQNIAPKQVLDAVRASPGNRVKVAVSDIDGVLRGKYLHKDKFFSAAEGGFGFCDVVFGWDMTDQCYDNTTLTGWHKGFPDALARIDLGTLRHVPWDDDVPFFLGTRRTKNGKEVPHPVSRQLLKRVLKRREALASFRCAAWNSNGSTSPRRRSRGPIRAMCGHRRSRRGCSATRCAGQPEPRFFKAR